MKADEIRSTFLNYFENHGHHKVPSSSLIPQDDPTLLFTNAGMVPFKKIFTGEEKRDYIRATSSQKCVRAGGKHNDLENVGYTARHHTFFEMLGNFSFGDYFKSQAIEFAWELLTKKFKLPPEKLYITVYTDDDEAAILWPKLTGIASERVIRLGTEDNFWAMGDTGPCGPCSEVLIDQGKELGCDKPNCAPGCDCDRYLEIWNLVFMQFERNQEGQLIPLPKPSIDTGMGLERLAAVSQNVKSNFETDLFRPLIDHIADISGHKYIYEQILNPQDPSFGSNVSNRVVADHARAAVFLVGDGIRPENIGQGYVLRRIIRRALRHGQKLGLKKSFLSEIGAKVITLMSSFYPDLKDNAAYIKQTIKMEEDRFRETLESGSVILNEELERLKSEKGSIIDGQIAFKLYDTYGFPVDLVEDVGREHGFIVDLNGFDTAMEAQKETSRASWRGNLGSDDKNLDLIKKLTAQGFKPTFTGYDSLEEKKAKLILIIKDGTVLETAKEGQEVILIFDKSPLYAAAGGQDEDRGWANSSLGKAEIYSVKNALGTEIPLHFAKISQGQFKNEESIHLTVDAQRRGAIARNHTATHILHKALRQVLGEQVRQAGSLVSADRLRFDFTHFEAVSVKDLEKTEEIANKIIRQNLNLTTELMTHDKASKSGAIALFEERYGDEVRVVSIADFSKELCGGTHSKATGDLGSLLILGESSVSSGVRRLEALTGFAALKHIQNERRVLKNSTDLLKTDSQNLFAKISTLQEKIKELEKAKHQVKSSENSIDNLLSKIEQIGPIKALITTVITDDHKMLRTISDQLKDKSPQTYLVLGAKDQDGKGMLLAVAPDEFRKKFPAGNLVKEIVSFFAGRGGGRPDMAQAGIPNADDLEKALLKAKELLSKVA